MTELVVWPHLGSYNLATSHLEVVFPWTCVLRNRYWETSSLPQSWPIVSMASDMCLPGVICVLFYSGLLCAWKPVLRDFLPVAVPSFSVYGCRSVHSWCSACCVLFKVVVFLETSTRWQSCLIQSCPVVSMASDVYLHGVSSVVSCSGLSCSWKPVLRYLLSAAVPSCCVYWLLICAVMVFWVLCPVPACCVPGNQCWDTSISCLLQSRPVVSMASDVCRWGVLSVMSCSGLLCSWKPVLRYLLSAAVPSCCVYGFWSMPSWCFECCVLFRPVVFLETSVEIPPVCCSPVLLCLWILICAIMLFWVLCPVPACYFPGKQCCENSCLLQSCPVVYMASDQCRRGVLSVVSCSGQLYSWKPVLRDLPASVLSWRVYGCRSAHSWCSACCVLFRPVLFLETSVKRPACCNSVLLCLWLLICAVRVFWVLCPALTCWVPGNQCWETSCLLQSRPVVS